MRAANRLRFAVLALLVASLAPGAAAGWEEAGLAFAGLDGSATPPSAAAVRELKQQRAERARRDGGLTATTAMATSTIVDCSKNKSLQAAIDQASSGAVIEVRGLCHENVRIDHKPLTLRGADPALDGIRGVAPPPGATVDGALTIVYTDGVRVESLSIENGTQAGVQLFYSHVTIVGCRVSANAAGGVRASAGSFLDGSGLVLANNVGGGLVARRGSTVFCSECELSGNASFAGNATFGAILSLLDSTVSGTSGIVAQVGSYADVDCTTLETAHPCSLDVTARAALSFDRSAAALLGVEDFSGSLESGDNSQVSLFGATQLSTGVTPSNDPRRNLAVDFSTLWVESSRLKGDTVFSDFARGLLLGATVDGTVTCNDAADAFARDGLTLTPGSAVVGCEHVP